MTRIKFCGMTRIEDVRAAALLGVDAVGLVFTARSRRRVALEQGHAIRAVVPPFVSVVALFMDDDPAWIEQVLSAVQPDLLQFHGSEAAAACRRYGRPYLKAVGMADPAAAALQLRAYPDAAGLLLDGHGLGQPGGGGQAFDWAQMPAQAGAPLILAGGLGPGNVAAAVRSARPWGVDVASGIEAAPGIKDAAAMAAFVRAVRGADRGD